MNSQKNVLLSAGLLFLLIDEVKLDKRAQEYYLAGNSDPQAKPIVLSDLIFVFTEHRYTIPDPECSKFITCGSNGSKNIPFNKQSYADTFDDIIKNTLKTLFLILCSFYHKKIHVELIYCQLLYRIY